MQFYKYVTPSTARIVLISKTLRWTSPTMLNDPFDMQFAFQFRANRANAIAMAMVKCWQHYYGEPLDRPLNELGRTIREFRGKFPHMGREEFGRKMNGAFHASFDKAEQGMKGLNVLVREQFALDKILCFSEKPDNILMWSYYAQNHAGAVLRFTDQTPNNPLQRARRIRYVDMMPSLFDDEMLSDMLAGYKGMDEKRIMDELIYSKSSPWAHEAEWRVYSGRGRTSGLYEDIPFNAAELDGVIFGAKMNDSDRSYLTNLLRSFYPHVQLLQAKPMPDAYGLSIEIADENSLVASASTKISLLLRILLKRAFPILKSRLFRRRG